MCLILIGGPCAINLNLLRARLQEWTGTPVWKASPPPRNHALAFHGETPPQTRSLDHVECPQEVDLHKFLNFHYMFSLWTVCQAIPDDAPDLMDVSVSVLI